MDNVLHALSTIIARAGRSVMQGYAEQLVHNARQMRSALQTRHAMPSNAEPAQIAYRMSNASQASNALEEYV